MQLKILGVIFLLLCVNSMYAQEYSVTIEGSITLNERDLKEGFEVVLHNEIDTFIPVTIDETGYFWFETRFQWDLTYTLEIRGSTSNQNAWSPEYFVLHTPDDSLRIQAFSIETTLTNIRTDKFDNSAYYTLNETREFENFEIELFLKMLENYPDICLKFSQTKHPDERDRIAEKRMQDFKKFLLENGVNTDKIEFSDEIKVIGWAELEYNAKARIYAEIISLEGCQ